MPQRHRPELSESVMAEPLVGTRRSPRTFGSDRVCDAPGCLTRLSIYNGGSFCASHSAHRVWRPARLTPEDELSMDTPAIDVVSVAEAEPRDAA